MQYVNFKSIGLYFILYQIILFVEYNNLISIVYIAVFFSILYLIISPIKGIFSLLTLLFLFDDLPYDLELLENFASIHTSLLFGQTISKILILFLLVIVSRKFILEYRANSLNNGFIKLMRNLCILALIVGIFTGNIFYFNEYINDLRFFVNFFIGFLLVVLFLKDGTYRDILPTLSSIFIAKVLSILILAFYLSKSDLIYKITTDTGFYLMIFFILYFLVIYNKMPSKKYWSFLGIASVIIALGVSASRGRMVIVILALGMFLYATKNFSTIPKIALACFLGLSLVPVVSPEMYNYLIWKVTSFNPEEGAGESSLIRYIEFSNIVQYNLNHISSFFFGRGLGGFWTSHYTPYPFSLYGTNSYPDEWIENDKFFKPHGIVQFLLLKVGFIGTLFFYGFLVRLFFQSKAYFQKLKNSNSLDSNLVMALSAGMLPFFLVAFSSKLQLFGGVIFGLWYCYLNYIKQNENNHSS